MKAVNRDIPKYHPSFACCELISAAHRKDMVEYASVLMNEDREIEALGVLKLAVLQIEFNNKAS